MSTVSHTPRILANSKPAYLDCAATTPLDPAAREIVFRFLSEEFGNEGSRTHDFGTRAKQAVQAARDQIAAVVACQREEVIFTSGATESNNLAILGLERYGVSSGKRHIVTTAIEHKAVLEPLQELQNRGFEVEHVLPSKDGQVQCEAILRALRPDTLLVSVMHANNETGVVQPVDQIAKDLESHETFFHVDAAQTFGKTENILNSSRIDLLSLSGHKIFGPKGVGALIARRRGFNKAPLAPLFFGGGQERGLRPGTLPVALIVGFGEAARVAAKDFEKRSQRCAQIRRQILTAIEPLNPSIHGTEEGCLPHILNLSIPGLDSEYVMLALRDDIAISNGSACTSASYKPSHVLAAMGLSEAEIQGAIRLSWCHMTPDLDWKGIVQKLAKSA